MALIVESDPVVAASVRRAVGEATVIDSVELLRPALDVRPAEHAVILGSGVALAAAVTLADTLRVTRPSLSVILVRERVDTTVLAEALRSGMREVVALDDLDALETAVRRAQELHDAMTTASVDAEAGPAGRVLTVFSAKGGVGKTTISTNLAVALADGGKHQVCVVDLDLSFGDVAIALQIFPNRTIADTVTMQESLDSEGLESLLTPYRDGVYALAAPVQPDAKDSISAVLVGQILQLLRERFAYVIIDTPPAFDDVVLQAFDDADMIVLVATPDIPALKNLKIATETINLLNIPRERLRVVLNRADARVGVSPEEVAASLQMEITSTIPSSRDVPAAVNRGELLFLSEPRHPVSQGIGMLASDAAAALRPGPLVDDADEPRNGSRRRRSGLFARKGRDR